MATEHNLRRRQELSGSVVPQTTTLEENVVAQREQDLVPQLPESVEELLSATFGEAGSSGLTELQTRFARDETAFLAGQAVEQRLRRYLFEEKTKTPSRFARALVGAGHNLENMAATDRRTLAEMQMYLVSELNPLLRRWQAAVQPYGAETNLLETLSYGTVERDQGRREQRTVSAIGLMRQLSQLHQEFTPLQSAEVDHPQHLVVERPFSDITTQYWRMKLKCDEVYRATEPNQLIGWRTRHLQIVLEEAAETVATSDPDHDRIVAAYDTMIDWLDVHAEAMEEPLRIDKSDTDRRTFDYFVSRMDFSHGDDTNTVSDIVNAAEVIKQYNPELFMRMVGIAPGHELRVDQEAQRSDLFGSAFHMALYRTLQLDHPRFRTLHDQVRQLTELDVKAKPLVHLNEAQVRQIAAKFQGMALAEQPDTMAVTMLAATFAGLAARHPREVALALMVNSVEQDSRTEMLERLKVSGPHDFFTLIKGFPKALLDDPACIDIARKRLELDDPRLAREHIELIRIWDRDKSEKLRYRSYNWDIKNTLWRTAPDEALLTEDFWRYLASARHYAYNHEQLYLHYWQWRDNTGHKVPEFVDQWREDEREEKHAEMETLILEAVDRVVRSHPHISKTQWLEWYRNTKGLPGKGIGAGPIDPDGKREAIQALAAKIHGFGEDVILAKVVGITGGLFKHTSFPVLFGPEASQSLNSLGFYNPGKKPIDSDIAFVPSVAGALDQRSRIDIVIRNRDALRSRSMPEGPLGWPKLDNVLVAELRTAYKLLSIERFINRYRATLVHLGADYIMDLRDEAGEADFAELVEQLYFPTDYNTETSSAAYHVRNPEVILATNPWQVEVYDALEAWVNQDPRNRKTYQTELNKVKEEFFNPSIRRLCLCLDNLSTRIIDTEQIIPAQYLVNVKHQLNGLGKPEWNFTQIYTLPDQKCFRYDSQRREITT